MEKLIITATCDSTMSFPSNPNNPTPHGVHAVASEYVRCAEAGAAISHIHGVYSVDAKIQPDGTKLSDLDIPGWGKMRDEIVSKCDTIMQYGIANGRFPQRKVLMQEQQPDMISTCFNCHDECFDNEPGKVPVELYGLHTRDELTDYCEITSRCGVRMEVEAFHYGAVWNAMRMIEKGHMHKSVWITFFLGWKGGCWTPPTLKAMMYMSDHCPKDFIWNTSVMDPVESWKVLASAISLGGHVRVGMEDNPFITPGQYARSNAELVEKIVRIAREIGREIATPDEARAIIGLTTRQSQPIGRKAA